MTELNYLQAIFWMVAVHLTLRVATTVRDLWLDWKWEMTIKPNLEDLAALKGAPLDEQLKVLADVCERASPNSRRDPSNVR